MGHVSPPGSQGDITRSISPQCPSQIAFSRQLPLRQPQVPLPCRRSSHHSFHWIKRRLRTVTSILPHVSDLQCPGTRSQARAPIIQCSFGLDADHTQRGVTDQSNASPAVSAISMSSTHNHKDCSSFSQVVFFPAVWLSINITSAALLFWYDRCYAPRSPVSWYRHLRTLSAIGMAASRVGHRTPNLTAVTAAGVCPDKTSDSGATKSSFSFSSSPHDHGQQNHMSHGF